MRSWLNRGQDCAQLMYMHSATSAVSLFVTGETLNRGVETLPCPVQDIQFHKRNCYIQAWPLPEFLFLGLCFPRPSWQVLISGGFLTLWTAWPEADYLRQQPGGRFSESRWSLCFWLMLQLLCTFLAEIPHHPWESARCKSFTAFRANSLIVF